MAGAERADWRKVSNSQVHLEELTPQQREVVLTLRAALTAALPPRPGLPPPAVTYSQLRRLMGTQGITRKELDLDMGCLRLQTPAEVFEVYCSDLVHLIAEQGQQQQQNRSVSNITTDRTSSKQPFGVAFPLPRASQALLAQTPRLPGLATIPFTTTNGEAPQSARPSGEVAAARRYLEWSALGSPVLPSPSGGQEMSAPNSPSAQWADPWVQAGPSGDQVPATRLLKVPASRLFHVPATRDSQDPATMVTAVLKRVKAWKASYTADSNGVAAAVERDIPVLTEHGSPSDQLLGEPLAQSGAGQVAQVTHLNWSPSTVRAESFLSLVHAECPAEAGEEALVAWLEACSLQEGSAGGNLRRRCLSKLQALVDDNLGFGWKVAAFGSAANGFGTEFGDLDAVCYRPGAKARSRFFQRAELLSSLPALRQHPDFAVKEEVLGARIPIVKLEFEGCLEVDLSFHNIEPLPNTRLLRAYADLDPVVKLAGVFVKSWAKVHGVSGAASYNLSSYSLILMVLFYLQVDPKVAMPCLPTDEFMDFAACEGPSSRKWVCPVPLWSVLVGFFKFYVEEFDWGCEVVSVRVGQRRAASEACFLQLESRGAKQLHIEDPFLLERNLGAALRRPTREKALRDCLEESLHSLLTTSL